MVRIRCQYVQYYNETLENILKENKIPYCIIGNDVNMQKMLKFFVYEGTAEYDSIDKYVEHNSINPLRSVEYTKVELEDAQLLSIRPTKQCIEIVNDETAFEYSCVYKGSDGLERRSHCKQVDVLQIRREPKLSRNTTFYSIDTGFSELFADSRVFELSQKCDIRGMKFAPVKLRNGHNSDTFFQVFSEHVFGLDDIITGNGEEIISCPLCGKHQLVIDNAYQLSLSVRAESLSEDFYMTAPVFGEGQAEPIYIISQRFYRILRENALLGNLIIAPVQLYP